MNIDFSAYEPGTVLRVRCRDGGKACLFPHNPEPDDEDGYRHLLVRDEEEPDWVQDDGSWCPGTDNCYDVVEIIARMVEAPL